MPHPEISAFRHRCALQVRFADLDLNGHLNHAKYLTFMEHARLEYTAEVLGIHFSPVESRPPVRMILANVNCDYLLPVLANQEVIVHSRCPRLGRKSFQMEHLLLADGERAAYGHSTVVAYDYGAGRAVPLPETWRQRITAYEPVAVPDESRDA
ncbi:MAG: thioesterase family protein [Anaerolineaceae bacterium]|nr:thioesterase family protein [Anaerolineaceae bacterium]